ncbi:TonB-dependent receptor [Swingsia samuiensis]|uniref:TonB-dependent receptor n=1 Tax=Swingsia samuiensis TaxID=1293412 RepID=A0A4Y6UI12_9PROT|nr:TonB-dependent receptor [Swingsia samuiensis]QDH16684.1 TonB-dependent receptor [Swingsia samuiensis]
MTRFVRNYITPLTIAGTFLVSAQTYAASMSEQKKEKDKKAQQKTDAADHHNQQQSVDATHVEKMTVHGHMFNTMHQDLGFSRMPQDVMHTPQNINVVPHELMQQQNVKSLDEALRNVPGVTTSIGEGAGGMNGDQFLIRGFPAQNDMYEDGLRDFGVYSRDSFNLDTVSVIKGPSSEVFGNGTTGGAINMVTKAPTLKDRYSAEFSGGSGSYYRGTLDFNKRLGDSTAFRITGMGDEHNLVGRDYLYSHRWGIAPSLTFGLGKKATLVLQYMHQQENSIPDYGVPVVKKPGAAYGQPITEYGVRRTNWYGTENDQNATNDNMETARFSYNLNKHIKFYDDLRGGEYYRTFGASKTNCDATCVNNYFLGDPNKALVARSGSAGAGKGTGPGTFMAPLPYEQRSWSVQNVGSMVADFKTGFLRHQVVTGFDLERVSDVRAQKTYLKATPYASLVNPNPNVGNLNLVYGQQNPSGLVNLPGIGAKSNSNGYGFDTGMFFYDQIWLVKWLSVKGGFRWDRWQTSYNVKGGDLSKYPDKHFHDVSNVFNPNVSLIATPDEHQTYYFTWASSTTPMGMYVTNGSVPIRPGTNSFASPEKSQLYEIGAKYSLFHDRMGFTASLFRLDKGNALYQDPNDQSVTGSSDTQRNQGLELSAGGVILPGWNVTATYALYDSSTRSSSTPGATGKNIQNVPHNQATLWSVYSAFPNKVYNVSFGGGVTWRQHVWLDVANTMRAPANLDFDAVISHHFNQHWKVSMNGYNLANRVNYQNLFANRATPSTGRTFLGQLEFVY